MRVKDYGKFDIIGRTRDDAAGEAFDKVARAIGLGYPGGPKIDKVSKEGNPEAIAFPRAHVEDAPYDFSFSGLKSAVLNYINGCQMKGIEYNQADIAASFQKAVTDVLVANAMHAVEEFRCGQAGDCRWCCIQQRTSRSHERGVRKERGRILLSVSDFLYRQCSNDRRGSLL